MRVDGLNDRVDQVYTVRVVLVIHELVLTIMLTVD